MFYIIVLYVSVMLTDFFNLLKIKANCYEIPEQKVSLNMERNEAENDDSFLIQ